MKSIIDYLWEEHCDKGKRRQLYACGMSMGAGMLVNYLIEEGDKTPLTAAFSLSCFFNSQAALNYFRNQLFGLYDLLLSLMIRSQQRHTF